MNEIRNSLNAGKEVITHTDAVSVPGWSGAGYIITDPDTGAGAYKISGGGNGSYFLGLFLGFTISLILATAFAGTVLSAGIAGPLLIPILISLFGHLTIFSLLLVEDAGFDRACFFGGLLAGLAPLGLVLIAGFGSLEAGVSSILGILGFANPTMDLDGTKSSCGV